MSKKKVKEEKELVPSKYQMAIIDFVKHGNGNLLVDASAGCGKTSSLIMVIKEIPSDASILYCAFNRDIVNEIRKKTKDFDNVEVTTVHSLGLRMLKNNLGKEYALQTNENKYKTFIMSNISSLSSLDVNRFNRKEYLKYISNINELVNLFRLFLCKGKKEALNIVRQYNIELYGDEIDVAHNVLLWGKRNLEEVDFTDMIWLPHALSVKPYGAQYDYVLGDECQDFSNAQRELILRCKKINTRFIFVGDENQAIYGFAGSNQESFEKLRQLQNTTTLPLPISYRCAENIVRFAQNFVPKIEWNPDDDRKGLIENNTSLDDVKDGDMVVCRNNAPLMCAYNKFIKDGKPCYVRGKDIGNNLIGLVVSTKQKDLALNLDTDGVFTRLYEGLFDLRDKIIKRDCIDEKSAINTPLFANRLDQIRALEVLAEGVANADELIVKINNVFSDKKKEGISLSTVHKAKGLEADRVFILCNSLMPSKSAEMEWEKRQERNLMYVAYTRAKNYLSFLKESEIKDFGGNESLRVIEDKVNFTLQKVKMGIIQPSFNASIIKKEVEPFKPMVIGATTTLGSKQTQQKQGGLFNLTRKNTKKKCFGI